MPVEHHYTFERNSNSWHITHWSLHSHYEEDNEIIDYCKIDQELDLRLGALEGYITSHGTKFISLQEEMDMMLRMFPEPK